MSYKAAFWETQPFLSIPWYPNPKPLTVVISLKSFLWSLSSTALRFPIAVPPLSQFQGQILLCKQCTNECQLEEENKNQDWFHNNKVLCSETESSPEITDSKRSQRSWLDSGWRVYQEERGELWMQQGTLVLIFLAGEHPCPQRSYLQLTLVQKRIRCLALPSSSEQRQMRCSEVTAFSMYGIQATWWGTPTVLLLIHKDCKGGEEN